MPQTFVLPRQLAISSTNQLLSGALLSFFQTGTSDPQAVFSDAACTVELTQPVQALASGEFPKIYLDPNAEANYRVRYTTASGVLIYQEDDISLYPITSDEIVLAINARTDVEIAAGVTVNYRIPSHDISGEVYPERYLAAGDGITDDTEALRTAALIVQSLGGGTIRGKPGSNYRIFTGTTTGSLCAFEDLDGVAVLGYGCTLTVDLTRTITASIGYLFLFDNCSNIKVDGWTTNGPTLDVSSSAVKGWEFVHCTNGCRNLDMPNNRVVNALAGLICQNQTADLTLTSPARCRNIHIGILDCVNTWYGVNCQHSGDGLYIDRLTTDTVHRSLFIDGGMVEVRANIWAKDAKAIDVFLCSGASGIGLHDIKIDYHSGADSTANGTAERIGLYFGGSTPAKMTNIDIRMDIQFAGTGTTGAAAFRLFKRANGGGDEDTAVRGHELDGLRLSGVVKGMPSSSGLGMVTGTSLTGVWGAGDFFRNIDFSDLVLDSDGQVTGVDQHLWYLGGCTDNIKLSNVYCTGAFIVRDDQQATGRCWPKLATMSVDNVVATNRWVNLSSDSIAIDHQGFGANVTLSTGWSGKTLTNAPASGTVIYTLPAAVVGLEYKFARVAAFTLDIDPNGSETIGTGTAGQILRMAAAGNFVHLKCFVAGAWTQVSTVGTTSYV